MSYDSVMIEPSYIYSANVIEVLDGNTLDLEIDVGFDMLIRRRLTLMGTIAPPLVDPKTGVSCKSGVDAWSCLRLILPKKVVIHVFKNRQNALTPYTCHVFYLDASKDYVQCDAGDVLVARGHARYKVV